MTVTATSLGLPPRSRSSLRQKTWTLCRVIQSETLAVAMAVIPLIVSRTLAPSTSTDWHSGERVPSDPNVAAFGLTARCAETPPGGGSPHSGLG